ncbi:MAG: polysaccharide export protein [Candidatus Cloacimonetes bacterium]|nr:polysaccharide export protein [Candidatus Cloacimonadota bacterium]
MLKLIVIFCISCTLSHSAAKPSAFQQALNKSKKKWGTKFHKVETVKKGEDNTTYYMGTGDVLEITVLSLKEFQRKGLGDELEFYVNEDGNVNVPLVGIVKAEGKTVSDLILVLKKKFKKYVTNPQVSVFIKEYRSKKVYVLGKVYNNGWIPLRHEYTSLFEVLAEAGGFSAKIPSIEGIALNEPDMRHVYVIRNKKKHIVNLYDRLIDQGDDEPFIMLSGDKVFVPEPVKTVSILGGVRKAGSFQIKSGLTLLQAIALAGSFLEDARRDQVKIIRRNQKQAIRVNAVKIFEGKEKDFALKAGDVVYVAEW